MPMSRPSLVCAGFAVVLVALQGCGPSCKSGRMNKEGGTACCDHTCCSNGGPKGKVRLCCVDGKPMKKEFPGDSLSHKIEDLVLNAVRANSQELA